MYQFTAYVILQIPALHVSCFALQKDRGLMMGMIGHGEGQIVQVLQQLVHL